MEEKLIELYKKNYPFHMPGHKLGRLCPISHENLYEIDFTEIEETDNLHYPMGIIKEAQERAAILYGVMETHFLVNGSSCGILAAISGCCKSGDKILMARNSHMSVYNGVLVNQLEPIYLYPEVIWEHNILGGINPKDIETELKNDTSISCVIITSPTYEGIVSDIRRIADITHRYGKILIVDEAHGSHFKFHDFFPSSAIEEGADIIIHSLHKTLPALTQSALLHVNSNRVNKNLIKEFLRVYQTSSPSYILMSSIDSCLDLLVHKGEALFNEFVDKLKQFQKNVDQLENLQLLSKSSFNHHFIQDMDKSRIVIVGKERCLDGRKIEKLLKEEGIAIEMAIENGILLISTIADTQKGFDHLFLALKKANHTNIFQKLDSFDIINHVSRKYLIHEALQLESKFINYQHAENEASKGYVMVYPPGIPILVPGEEITQEIIILINKYLEAGLNVLGIIDGNIPIIEIERKLP